MMLFDDFSADPQPLAPRPVPYAPAIPGQHVLRLPLAATTRGVLLRLRGNGQACQMILRTRPMAPHQGYQTEFPAPTEWRTLNLLLSDFQPIGGVLRRAARPEALYGYSIQSGSPEAPEITRVSFY